MAMTGKSIRGCRSNCASKGEEGDPCPYLVYTAPYGQVLDRHPHTACSLLKVRIPMEFLPGQDGIDPASKKFRSLRPKECPVMKPNLFNWKEERE